MPHILGISSDITKLVFEKDMYEQLMELSPAPMYIKSENGRYVSANKSFAALAGVTDKADVREKCAEEFFVDAKGEAGQSDMSVLNGESEESRARVLTRITDGKEIHLIESKSTATVVGENGNLEKRLLGCDLDETDSRTKATLEAMKTFEHAVKDAGSKLLLSASDLIRNIPEIGTNQRMASAAANVLRSAIYISGPQNFFKGWKTHPDRLSQGRFASMYESALRSRLRYHRDYAGLCNKEFAFPESLPSNLTEVEIVQHHELVANVLDIVAINAVQHGGASIRVEILKEVESLVIDVQDNGDGFPEQELIEVERFDSGELDLANGHVGLKTAKQALAASGMLLELHNRNHSDGFIASARISIPIVSSIGELSDD